MTMPNILLERFLLAAMYFATNGPNWKYEWEEERSTLSVNFLKNTSVCEWVGEDYMDDQGVFCDENLRVTEIHGTSWFLSCSNFIVDTSLMVLFLYYSESLYGGSLSHRDFVLA